MQTVLVVLGGLAVGYLIGRFFAAPGPERSVRVQPPPMDDTFPPPGESARKAAEFARELGALVERLVARDVAVPDLVCEPGTRWQLVVERGTDVDRYWTSSWESGLTLTRGQPWVTRVSWDAGDADLRVAKSIREPGLFPNQWQEEPGRPIGPEGPLRAAEAFILERLAAGAGPGRGSRP